MKARANQALQRQPRRDRLIQDPVHDPYRAKRKLPEPTACPDCGAVFRQGSWRWTPSPLDAHRHLCPACQRVRDDYPAGHVTVKGEFLESHGDEILSLVRNLEKREKTAHPLHRIMDTRTEQHALVITTTDIHLARAIGEALHDAYQGELDHRYSEEERLIRVTWSR